MYHELINFATEKYPFITEHLNVRYIPHFHEEAELVYVIEGELEISFSARSIIAKTGDVCIIPQGQIHNLYTHTHSKTFVIKLYPSAVLDNIRPKDYIISKSDNGYNSLLRHITDIIRENEEMSAGYELAVNIGAQGIILTILREIAHCKIDNKSKTKHSTENDFLNSVNEFLNSNFSNDLRLCDVSSHFNYTQSYFCRRFKKITGESFWEYYTNYRLEKSIKFIRSMPNENFTVISSMSGFKNVRSFNQAFKNYFHCTPKEYRKMITN